jgi:hypothetical protein
MAGSTFSGCDAAEIENRKLKIENLKSADCDRASRHQYHDFRFKICDLRFSICAPPGG